MIARPRVRAIAAAILIAACSPKETPEPTAGSSGTSAVEVTSEGATTLGGTSEHTTSGDESTTTGEAMPPSCLPAELRGAWLGTVAGMNLYEAVDDAAYIIERPGAVVLDPDAVEALYQSLDWSPFFDGVPGLILMGYGLCLSPTYDINPSLCITLMLSTHTTTPDALAAHVAAFLSDAPEGCLGVRVDLVGLTEPRCTADDPECLPLNTCDDRPYDPEGPRLPLPEAPHEGACVHDGDCWENDCHRCDAWTVPGEIGLCSGVPSNCYLCGCIDGLCQWFTQGGECPMTCL